MMLFSFARSVTNRLADGGLSDSSLIKIKYLSTNSQNYGRRLRGFCLFRVFSGHMMNIRVHSCPFVVLFQISLLTRMEQNFAPHIEQKCSPLRLPCNGVGEFRSLMAS